jgi:hypothetical protein
MGNQESGGEVMRSFRDKVDEGVRHFKALFLEPSGCHIQEILQIIAKFPQSIMDEMNQSLEAKISKEEVLSTLSTM